MIPIATSGAFCRGKLLNLLRPATQKRGWRQKLPQDRFAWNLEAARMHLEYGLRNERKSPVFSCLRSSFDLKQVCLFPVAGDEIDP